MTSCLVKVGASCAQKLASSKHAAWDVAAPLSLWPSSILGVNLLVLVQPPNLVLVLVLRLLPHWLVLLGHRIEQEHLDRSKIITGS